MRYTASTFIIFSALLNFTFADQCGHDDDIACYNGGTCHDGEKNYASLGFFPFPFLETEKRGMHCACPHEPQTGVAKSGWTGVHCNVKYKVCPDAQTVCFNGGQCETEQFNQDKYHCVCPQDPKYDVWAGANCEFAATDFCDEDAFYDITGGKWFCTQGGKCNNGEKNLAKKCACPAGTYGLHCEYSEEQSCTLDCKNGGKCKVGIKDYSAMKEYGLNVMEYLGGQDVYGEHCACPKGFSGPQCEKEDVVRCGKILCFNGAECVQTANLDGSKVYNEYCRCKTEDDGAFAGKFCEHESTVFCPAPYGHSPDEYFCTNGGECPPNPHLPCVCKDGFTGPKCEIAPEATKEDECDLDCKNGGECFFGQSPVVDEELQNLHDSGLDFLMDNKHCRCPRGYIGLRCELKYEKCGDNEHYCLHGSGCVDNGDQYTCDCREAATMLTSYAGKYCEHAATEFCVKPGQEKNEESFCTNHGTCRGDIGSEEKHVGCDCKEGWTGKYCEIESLANDGVARRAIAGFMGTLFAIVLIFGGILLFAKCRKGDRDIEYEQTNKEEPVHNPYGEVDSDLSDGSEEEYEFQEVAII